MKIEFKSAEIVSRVDGRTVIARVATCPKCGNESWFLYLIADDHPHLQCTDCGETFCQGKGECGAETS